jgi:hypothetical protein
MIIPISKGKQVIFQQDGGPIDGTENARMILNEDLTLNFSSSYSSLSESSSPKAFKMIAGVLSSTGSSGAAGLIGGEWKQLGFQTWTGTEPLSTTLSIRFSMLNDAKTEVIDPMIALTKMVLPTETGAKGSLVGPGPSVLSAFEDSRLGKHKSIHCYIGNFKISNIILTRAVPTFSKHTDQFGYPIWGTMELSFTTIFSATVEMLQDMVGLL